MSFWGSSWGHFGVSNKVPYKNRFGDASWGPSWLLSWDKLRSKSIFNFAQISTSFLKGSRSLSGSILVAIWAPKSSPTSIQVGRLSSKGRCVRNPIIYNTKRRFSLSQGAPKSMKNRSKNDFKMRPPLRRPKASKKLPT